MCFSTVVFQHRKFKTPEWRNCNFSNRGKFKLENSENTDFIHYISVSQKTFKVFFFHDIILAFEIVLKIYLLVTVNDL